MSTFGGYGGQLEREIDTWLIMIKNNNIWMEYAIDMIYLPMICVMI